LYFSGWPKIFFGLQAHRRWHYTRDKQPVRFIRWHIRSVDAPLPETIHNLYISLRCWLAGTEPPWIIEAEAAEAEGEEERCACGGASDTGAAAAAKEQPPPAADIDSSSVADARENSTYKRALTRAGLVATLLCWVIFAWFIFVRARCCPPLSMHTAAAICAPCAGMPACAPLMRCVGRTRVFHNADIWAPHLQVARPDRGERLCALMGRVVWHERGDRVEGACMQAPYNATATRHPRMATDALLNLRRYHHHRLRFVAPRFHGLPPACRAY
jgi:hypothetical protein